MDTVVFTKLRWCVLGFVSGFTAGWGVIPLLWWWKRKDRQKKGGKYG